jgi:RNA polymerase sigma-70 factor, ECF subfamily
MSPESDRRHDAVLHALSMLSEQDREILTLTAWEGLAPRDIARVIDTSANVVRIRLHRARARIKKQLDLPAQALPRSAIRASE